MSLVTATWTTATSESVTRRQMACILCGIEFEYTPRKTGGGRVPRFCGEECSDKNYRLNIVTKEQRRIWRAQEKTANRPKMLAKRKTIECPVCLAQFVNISDRVPPKYCSKSCKQDAGRLALYSIDANKFRELISRHGNMCGICGSEEKLFIDHNHETGLVRGLLCSKCNFGIGNFNESIPAMIKAIQYLQEHE